MFVLGLKIALCQVNTTVLDLEGNAELIESSVAQALKQGANLAVFPEMCLSGYPVQDVALDLHFVRASAEKADRLIRRLPKNIFVAFGLILPVRADRRFREDCVAMNALYICKDGVLVGKAIKRLLPTYDVFDEKRLFVSGDDLHLPYDEALVEIDLGSKKFHVGFSICEDMWNPDVSQRYPNDPIDKLQEASKHRFNKSIDLMVNASASPFSVHHLSNRRQVAFAHAKKHNIPVAMVNAVGANDGLIFDGQSFVFQSDGQLCAQLDAFKESIAFVDFSDKLKSDKVSHVFSQRTDIEDIESALVLGIRDYFLKTGVHKAVIGVSGGIDSAVVLALAAQALPPEQVVAVCLPSKFTSKESMRDAQAMALALRTQFVTVPIQTLAAYANNALEQVCLDLSNFGESIETETKGITEENIQSRIRGNLLMAIANRLKGYVLSTGNKSELAMGYATLYGDTVGALSVLGDLYKHEVYALAKQINLRLVALGKNQIIPDYVLTRPPSAELRPDQKDEDTLPPYDILDEIVRRRIEEIESVDQIVRETGFKEALVTRVLTSIDRNEFKRRQAPLTLRVHSKSWTGRCYPIVTHPSGF